MTSDPRSHPHLAPQLKKWLGDLLIKSDSNSSVQEHMVDMTLDKSQFVTSVDNHIDDHGHHLKAVNRSNFQWWSKPVITETIFVQLRHKNGITTILENDNRFNVFLHYQLC